MSASPLLSTEAVPKKIQNGAHHGFAEQRREIKSEFLNVSFLKFYKFCLHKNDFPQLMPYL
jgi:hypothetical protein